MSYRFRTLALITLAVLAVSAIGSAIPLRSLSYLFQSALPGFGKPVSEREANLRPPAKLAPPVQTDSVSKVKPRDQFTISQDPKGEAVCRAATSGERKEWGNPDLESLRMRPINHLVTVGKTGEIQPTAAPNLTIVLRATQQLQQNPTASAAFTKAAQNWEDIIKSPVTIYIDVDYGTTRFGQAWPSGVLGATAAPSSSYPYQSVRTNLIAEANGEGNPTKQAIFNALPETTLPTNLGDASATDVADPSARAIGLLPATAQSTDDAGRIAFNSNFTFDFDPSDGITAGQIDFDAVATHEIGHALGFSSEAGLNIAKPSVWDLYRFRTGVTTSTFTAAQRILTIGGSPDPLQFYFAPGNTELGLSTGGPSGASTNGGDGFQSSHWKHVTGCSPSYIGIMDPALPSGCRRVITSTDMLALTTLGYNLTNNNSPPPPPPPPAPPANDSFASAQTISTCSGSVTGTNFSATSESGEPSHDPPDATSLSPSRSVWYQWQAPSSGSVTITTAGSDFDTIVAVYTGSTVGGLTQIVFNDDVQSGVVTSSVTFAATGGTSYRIAIDGWGGEQGGIKLNWTGCGLPPPTPTPTPTPIPSPTPTPIPCANTFTVNDNGDANDANFGDGVCATAGGVCTLRAAVVQANTLPSCGPINIDLRGVSNTITLNNGFGPITHSVNITGPGATQLTVQRSAAAGTPGFSVFFFDFATTSSMSGLTIKNGLATRDGGGGGIHNRSNLTLTDVSVIGNQANSIIGGGIFNDAGSLTIINSTISGNQIVADETGTPRSGGGIFNGGNVLNLINSTVSGNRTVNGASGPVHPDGGGIANSGNLVNIINCTITGNQAGDGGRGGGIYNLSTFTSSGTINLQNTIVANNTSDSPSSGPDLFGSFNSRDYNLIGNSSAGTVTGATTHNITNVNANLGPLSNNGGPTMTHALLAGSPAIDHGSNALAVNQNGNALTTDQRGVGFSRIVNSAVDIGAFELQTGDPATCIDDLWAATNTSAAPAARRFHTAIWTGKEMIVWGGHNGSVDLNTGARYNPATDTWTAISTNNAPTARSNHSAVWTGSEMIVWGGQIFGSLSGYMATGARYDPSTDSWTPISNLNAPLARTGQTAVWTGTEMIIWGGSNNTGILASGGRYNPSTDSWTAVTTANAPAVRQGDSAIWTGSEMILWGGAGIGLLNSGGRYNPASDTWTATSTANAPEVRAGHTAVWTGTEMIVWGGGGSGPLSTGGRYNPSTNSWTITSTTNAPAPRSGHTAVWNGIHMIVWGGTRGTNDRDLPSNGRYDPATDSWTLTCGTNAPQGRTFLTGVWTGGQMIIWGGEDSGLHVVNTGGRYSIQGENAISHPRLFVRQHYLDFFNREPDAAGWNFWTNQITSCGSNAQCIEVRRIDVSASFFLSIEFQNNGYLVERFHKVAYGSANGNSTFGGAHQLAVPIVRFNEFIQGTQRIGQGVIVLQPGWEQLLENNKQAYALEFVQTPRFTTALPTTMTPTEFVDKLNLNAVNILSATERTAAINLFGGAANSNNIAVRAQVVRQVAEDTDLYNAEYNRAFVLAEYFGYLRRNPNDAPESTLDYTGYDFWLTKLNQFNGNYINAEMVKAFLSSIEYRQRFGQ